MELRALAEQILRSDSLQDKLANPEITSDENPGTPWSGPTAPISIQRHCNNWPKYERSMIEMARCWIAR